MIRRLLFVSIFKEGEGGGEGRVAYEMARWFAQHYDVVMLCPGETTGLFSDHTGFKEFRVQSSGQGNVCVPLLSAAQVARISAFLDSYRPDVIHVHDPALLGVIAQLWGRLHRVPVFYTAHILPSHALEFGLNEASNLAAMPIGEALAEGYLLSFYKGCDAVIGLNARAAAEIRQFGYSGPVFVIPNGRRLSGYHACRFSDIRSEIKTLTFIGFISKRKNQAFLLQMMRYLPRTYHLRLIGEALTPAYQDELLEIVREHGLNVTFTGQLAHSQIAAELEQAHVFVSASKLEVQSLVIIEALASGTPVVGLSNETVDELVDATDGVRVPKDAGPEAFAAAVQRLCELAPGDYHALCEGARQRVEALDWSNVMAQTIQGYETIIAQRAQTSDASSGRERLLKFSAQIPPGKRRDAALGFVEHLLPPPRRRSRVNTRVWGIVGLNMAASVVLYYLLKGPLSRMVQRTNSR